MNDDEFLRTHHTLHERQRYRLILLISIFAGLFLLWLVDLAAVTWPW